MKKWREKKGEGGTRLQMDREGPKGSGKRMRSEREETFPGIRKETWGMPTPKEKRLGQKKKITSMRKLFKKESVKPVRSRTGGRKKEDLHSNKVSITKIR